jgi:hypothetical protein
MEGAMRPILTFTDAAGETDARFVALRQLPSRASSLEVITRQAAIG